VSYALRITDVDPLQYDLLFERFLNPERVSMPDIDIDFCQAATRRRDRICDREVWPVECRANYHVWNDGGKAAIKDVGRAMDLPYGKWIASRSSFPISSTLRLTRRCSSLRSFAHRLRATPRYADMMEVAKRLEGLARHASTHAAGVVISLRAAHEYRSVYTIEPG